MEDKSRQAFYHFMELDPAAPPLPGYKPRKLKPMLLLPFTIDVARLQRVCSQVNGAHQCIDRRGIPESGVRLAEVMSQKRASSP